MSSTSTDSLASILSKPPEEKWMFTEDQLQNTPSRRDNVPPAKELNYRQQAANLIQDMGQRLPVNQLTINTAIVYMHRFYIFHSFQAFSRFVIAPTALFLAAKVEEQPRKLEHVIRVCHLCLHPDKPHPDVHSDSYLKQAQQLVEHEIILLQTLGFDISIDHPHTHVVKCTQLVKASRDLSQMAYFMATNSLHLTTFCLKYKPTVVSAMCIHLSCKWSNYEIPLSSEGKAYWTYMDPSITEALLENIINEFLKILNLCPTRLRKLRNYKPSSRDGSGGSTPQSKDGQQSKPSTSKVPTSNRTASAQPATDSIARRPGSNQHPSEPQKKPTASLTIAEYKHKREKELMHNKQSGSAVPNESEKEKSSVSKPASAKPAVPSGQNAPPQRQGPPKPASVKPAVSSAQNAPLQRPGHHTASNPHKPSSRPGHSDGRPRPTAAGHPVVKTEPQSAKHPIVKIEPQTARHPEKIHPKAAGIHHKRPDKPHHPPQKPHPGQPSGIPGLQKPKHPTHQAHGMSQQHKEHHKMQPHHHQRPHPSSHHLKPVAAKPKELAPPRPKESQPTETKTKPSGNSDDNLLAGVEQKVMEQMKADKAREAASRTAESTSFTKPTQHAKPVQQQQQPHPSVKEHKSRHSMPDMPSRKELPTGRALSPSASKAAYKALYEQYKKNSEALKQKLKQKVQSEALTEEEKQIWQKLKKKEEDRQKRKRKHEKHKLNRSQPVESHSNNEEGNATPGGGPLTVRIKLPPSVRAEITKNQTSASGGSGSGHQIASSSGSGSEQTVSSPSGTVSKAGRKRTHVHDSTGHSDPISAKHSRKSEGHHHQSHHSSHESSKHRHSRHSRSSSHHHHHSKSRHSGHKIDEVKIDDSIFRQALSDAVSIVQSGHAAPSAGSAETSIPTVTLKRTGVQNGSGDSYVAHSSKHDRHKASRRSKQLGFDPAAPVSATPPEELFDGESGELPQSGTRNVLAMRNPDLSSPETGEIIDDEDQASPFRGHHSNRFNLHKDQSNNNNSSQHPEHRVSTSGVSGYAHHPPSLTHATHQNAELDGHKNHNNRLPPMPPLTSKPNRTEQK